MPKKISKSLQPKTRSEPLSNIDIKPYIDFFALKNNTTTYYDMDALPPLEKMFDTSNTAMIFQSFPEKNIGHWTLLIEWEPGVQYEYFDSQAYAYEEPFPDQIRELLIDFQDRNRVEVDCMFLKNKDAILQQPNQNNCAKWCIYRIMTLPTDPQVFYNMLYIIDKVYPLDDLINHTINIETKQ